MNRIHSRQQGLSNRSAEIDSVRTGFTLVEMLVSVALVLLMMLMFTEIFQLLSGSMTTQRGISENDQRERLLVTLFQSDLDNRTFQYLLPLANYRDFTTPPMTKPLPTDPRSPEYRKTERLGYFYISENDVNDDTDDILQFTVSRFADPNQKDDTEDFYYGKSDMAQPNIPSAALQLSAHPNQPDADDGRILADGTSQSSAAEVSYFLRGSNLYRRVLLIREPLTISGVNTSQPVTATGVPYFLRSSTGSPAPLYGETVDSRHNFWRDFDFSAFRAEATPPGSGVYYARFHDLSELDNSDASRNTVLYPLGIPHFRYGFNHLTGLSREFMTSTAPSSPTLPTFIGRFTHEETSHEDFNYPHDLMPASIGGGGNPMDASGPSLLVDYETRVVQGLEEGDRRSEDLVLSNVRSFDIKVFDDLKGDFVDIGRFADGRFGTNSGSNIDPKQNTVHGNATYKNVFDTWHPNISVGSDVDPPYPLLADNTPAADPLYDLDNQTTEHIPKPLSAIRIVVRYEDPSSGQLRQMTLIHSLRNKSSIAE
ncbi:type II secretion system protein [Gimesia chilikensis]|uniref:Prepilin-type N-terminal cleavage/methylation domain-containing protein n=1 Tax=Gimesia chilikensis TaxID=2605989 RepID=A0A517PWT1_9PLAN|nr:type II secretion system protein [Gimesia chilikensis]QDT23835.1 hypothetical protein HG66A1_56600 [Gimesia chilikensis]